MTFKFYLSKVGTIKNILLNLTDIHHNIDFEFHTYLKIPEDNWDKEKQRPGNIYLKKNKKLNEKLDFIKIKITEYIAERRLQGKTFTKQGIAKEIQRVSEEKPHGLSENSLLFLMQNYIHNKKDLLCNSTYKRYKVFFNLFQRFEGFMKKHFSITEINSDFVKNFLLFGRNEEYSENTIYRTIHFVKTILNFAERKGIRTHVQELELRREKQRKEIVTLAESEILKIRYTDVPEELQAAKDWLLISCYTGQRFSDFMQFSTEKLREINGRICISFTQQKTQKDILLPLHPIVLGVVEKNGNSFPKIMDIHHYNTAIKQIAKLAGLNSTLKANKRTGHRTRSRLTEKWQILSSHIGRRSFATNFYGKIPTPLLMEATGHSTEQMFLKYINPIDKDRIVSLSNYFDKMSKESILIKD